MAFMDIVRQLVYQAKTKNGKNIGFFMGSCLLLFFSPSLMRVLFEAPSQPSTNAGRFFSNLLIFPAN
jgi:hypothetical protein